MCRIPPCDAESLIPVTPTPMSHAATTTSPNDAGRPDWVCHNQFVGRPPAIVEQPPLYLHVLVWAPGTSQRERPCTARTAASGREHTRRCGGAPRRSHKPPVKPINRVAGGEARHTVSYTATTSINVPASRNVIVSRQPIC